MSRWTPIQRILFATTALVPLGFAPALANPNGPQVVGGSATVSGVGTAAVTVRQNTDKAIINWRQFDIAPNERTQFIQPSANSIALNRVTGGLGPSQLYGTLTANGRIFLVNPDGILFGRGAVIDTAGFLATTNDIKNSDFMAGRYNFTIPGRPDASIVNQGVITASGSGFAALVAPGVRNSGTITATFGTVGLAAGNGFTLDFYGDRLITLSVNDSIAATVKDVATGQPLDALVKNEGKLSANGGRVELSAAAARKVVDSVINNTGVVEAKSIGTRNGMIVLGAATAASKPAGAPAQTVKLSGKLSVAGKKKGTKGGTIQVTGEDIRLAGATLDASGRAGGGTVLIGGDVGGGHPNAMAASIAQASLQAWSVPTATTVSVDGTTRIDALARSNGNAGKVVLWADGFTAFNGAVKATGGARGGNGGFVEVSGKQTLAFNGSVDTRAPNGNVGTLLLDPGNVTLGSGTPPTSSSGPGEFTGDLTSNTFLSVSTLLSALNAGNVVVATSTGGSPSDGNILVNSSFSWGGGASAASSLKLSAYRDIIFSPSVTVANTGSGNLALRADSTGSGIGTVTFQGTGLSASKVDFTNSTGRVDIFFNPTVNPAGGGVNTTSYVSPAENYFGSVSGQRSAYMLVNTVQDLQNTRNNSSGIYALGKNIDASTFITFVPLGTFTGMFEGDGRTISNLAANGPAPLATNAGTIRNLTLNNISVTATTDGQFLGLLAGQNTGAIENVSVSGTISGGTHTSLVVGGLVGINGGTLGGSTAPGMIAQSHAAVNVITGDGGINTANTVGGLVGFNPGTITQSSASGSIVVGANTTAGGLVGSNQPFFVSQNTPISGAPAPLIDQSFATGDVSSTGVNVHLGGLVGYNFGQLGYVNSGLISDSRARGAVTANASAGTTCNVNMCDFLSLGGLVGFNQGFILGSVTPNGNSNLAVGLGTYALGPVSVGSNGMGGGLVGQNDGIIGLAMAKGAVTGAAGVPGVGTNQDRQTTLGGLAGSNQGIILDSRATGNVGTPGVAHLEAGGLVGWNAGAIGTSQAEGQVKTGDYSAAGGLAGSNGDSNFTCSNCNFGVGFNTAGAIVGSTAIGSVTVGAVSLAGGLAGFGGSIVNSDASGAVTGGDNSILGGLAAVVGPNEIVANSHATGAVTGTGSNNWIGGLIGLNAGVVSLGSSASGAVTGDASSVIGGLVGLNIGLITNASTLSTATVTGTGADNVVGGLVGANFGTIVDSHAAGAVAGGLNNTAGSLVGANGNIANVAPGQVPLSTFPVGTIDSLSTGTGTVNGVVGPQVGSSNLAALPKSPSFLDNCDDNLCIILKNPTLISTPTTEPDLPDDIFATALVLSALTTPDKTQQTEVINALIALTPPGSPPPGAAPPPGSPGGPAGGPPPGAQTPGVAFNVLPPLPLRAVPGADGERFSSVPPLNETRFLNNEVVLQVLSDTPLAEVQRIAQQLGVTVITSQGLGSISRTAYRFNTNGRPIRDVIRALEANRIVAVASPNYRFRLTQQPAAAQPAGAQFERRGDPSQYMMGKLRLDEAHRIADGRDVTVAVIDSEVDKDHSELAGAISDRFNAAGENEKGHSHGTAMAGAIVARDRLMGVAPAAKILAVRAFSQGDSTAESTTYSILKSIDWAVSQGARVINMSFAGPPDPSLKKALKNAYDKGVVLIAAAGNAGPKSPPLYPGADPSVIAVTATDSNDRGFRQANQGFYVAVSAPGVDILAPAPEAAYQMSTGTSIATAHVSGVVALMLQRDPTLTPVDVRRILEATAIDLGPKGRDAQFGWGLVSPQRALAAVDARKAATPR